MIPTDKPSRDWMGQALCAGVDPEVWFPPNKWEAKTAISFCQNCPVIKQCASYATATGQQYGVWGGELLGTRTPRPQRNRAGQPCYHVPAGEDCPICLILNRREREANSAECQQCGQHRLIKSRGLCSRCYRVAVRDTPRQGDQQ